MLLSFSRQIVSDSSRPHRLQHTRLPCSLSLTISRSLPKFMSIESVMLSSHLILYHPLLLLPSIFPSTGIFSNKSALCIGWSKCWSFSFSISPSNDWFDLLAVQGTLKSLLQNRSLKASILWPSTFFNQKVDVPLKKVTDGIKLSFPSESKLFLVILLIA